MKSFKMDGINEREMRPGFFAKFVHGEEFTFANWRLLKDAVLEEHAHPHEQLTFVLDGKMRFYKPDGGVIEVGPGEGILFGSNEPHKGVVLEETNVIDIFSPVREDFK